MMMKFHFALILLLLLKLNIPPVYICRRPPDWGCSSLVSPKIQQNYTDGSMFQSNLQQLLAALPQKAMQNNYFHYATHGEAPDQVYGLIMCYANASTSACKSCLTEAPNCILDCCAFNKNGVAWYHECMIRYSDVAFNATNNLGLMGCQPKVLDSKPESLTEPKKFRVILRKLFDGLATNASTSPLRWAAGKMNYTSSTANIYALAQCTRQLLPDDCKMCIASLTDFGVESCTGDTAAQADETLLTSSCYARFALKPFYLISEAHPPWPNSGTRSREPVPIHILTIIIGGLLALLPNIRL